ncbi:MAG TPA: thioredoxin family protein [Opitutaceae bacterium]|jgi:hypothetical protein|nr:thioredoxin family protein [Opitutaceae bacterium]
MKLLRIFLASVGTAGAAFVSLAEAAVDVGQTAPDFILTGIDGQQHRLSEYKGKIVVLEWNNPDCPFVHKHYDSGNIPRLQHEAMAEGVVWLMINSNAPDEQGGDYSSPEIAAWLAKRDASPSAYLRDPSGKVGRMYGAKTTPHLFVIRPDGILAYEGAIDSIRSTRQSDIPRAENYVAEALTSVETGKPVLRTNTQPYGCAVKY